MKEKFEFSPIPVKGIEKETETEELVNFFKSKNYYERLGVSSTASPEEVEKVFGVLRLKYNYEKFPQVFMLIHEAAALLTDPKHRGRHNKEIGISDPRYPYSPDPKAEFYRKKHRMVLARGEAISDFIEKGGKTKEAVYYETLLNFKEHVKLKLGFSLTSITQLKGEIMALEKDGFLLEDVIIFVESASQEYFLDYVTEITEILNKKHHKDLDFHMEGAIRALSALETFGIQRTDIIEQATNRLFVYMDEYIEDKIKFPEDFAIASINRLISYLKEIGLPLEGIKENILRANYRLRNRELLYSALFE